MGLDLGSGRGHSGKGGSSTRRHFGGAWVGFCWDLRWVPRSRCFGLLSNLCSFVHKELKGLLWDNGFESATTTMIGNTIFGGAAAAMGLFTFTFMGGT